MKITNNMSKAMKDLFKEFYRPTEKEFQELWEKATFVFDTNILLNLYRFPEEASKSLIDSISEFSERIWLPHQVGLEFANRRLEVIADQKKRFKDVQLVVENSYKELAKKNWRFSTRQKTLFNQTR